MNDEKQYTRRAIIIRRATGRHIPRVDVDRVKKQNRLARLMREVHDLRRDLGQETP